VPLSEINSETQASPRDADPSAIAPYADWRTWPEAVYRLWSQRRRILRWVILGTLLAALAATRICKYEGVAQLMPPDTGPSGLAALAALSKGSGLSGLSSPGVLGDMMGIKSSGALYAKVLQSRTLEDRLLDRFHLQDRYSRSYREDARIELAKRTSVEEDKKSGVLTIVVRDRDPVMAAALAGAYVEELDNILNTVSTSSARRERIFVEERLGEERKALDESERRYAQFASANMALDVPEQTRVSLGAAARLEGELVATRSELAGIEQIYAADNVRVKSLRARIGVMEAELRKVNGEQPAAAGKSDPANPYPGVKRLPGLGVEWSDLYRTAKIHETIFEMLTQEYELARIQEAKEIPRVKVLDAPTIPEKLYPRPPLLVLLGTILSAMLAAAGVLLQDVWDRWDAEDPRKILFSNILSWRWRKR
jgi:capsule polysaccharide export protein KpsE/RkpR